MLFFLATFLLTWICWIPIAKQLIKDDSAFRSGLVLLGTFAPALASMALTTVDEGMAGLRSLLGPMFLWQVPARWYILALSYMAATKLAASVAFRLIRGTWPAFGSEPWYILIVATIFSTPVQAGEELGWRGYALPRLANQMGFACASIVIGVVWALWHLPIFFIAGADKYGQSFPVWALGVVAVSVAVTFVYAGTRGSLLLTMLMHAAANNTSGIVPAAAPGATQPFSWKASLMLWLTTVFLWLSAAYFLMRMRGKGQSASA
jgi:membrane protease YdiL (CAAX protease family)